MPAKSRSHGKLDSAALECGRHSQNTGHPGSVVASPRRLQTVVLDQRRNRSIDGEDRIDVGRKHYACAAVRGPLARATTKHIAFGVDLDLLQLEFPEAFRQPLRAPVLAKRRRGDRHQLLLPLHHLAFMQMEPLEGRVDARQRSQMGDAGKS